MQSNCNTDYLGFKSEFNSDDEAVYDCDENIRYTFGDIEKRSNILGNYLREELKIEKGDRVAFCSRNRVELIDAYFTTAKIGAILTTYNPGFAKESLLHMVKNETPRILFYEKEFTEKIEFLKRTDVSIEIYINLSKDENTRDLTYLQLMDNGNQSVISSQNELEDIHMIIHTGGTTGVPKGAMISYRALLFNAFSETISINISKNDVAFITMPLFHTAGWNVLTIPVLLAGGRIVISKQFNHEITLKMIEKEKVTVSMFVPTMLRMMLNSAAFDTTDFSSLRWIISGGAPTPIDILERYWEKNIKLFKAYGMTEIGPNNTTIVADNISLEALKLKGESVGKPMYFNRAKIVNDNGELVKKGKVGELFWAGSLVFSGYWNDTVETENIFKNGWVRTGDLAREDEDGYYYIVGRKKNMYISGGENIFPQEIENVIMSYRGVQEVVVIGYEDKKWGEVGKAIVELESNQKISIASFKRYLQNRLGSLKTPRYFEFVKKIPKNGTGKIEINEVIRKYRNSEEC